MSTNNTNMTAAMARLTAAKRELALAEEAMKAIRAAVVYQPGDYVINEGIQCTRALRVSHINGEMIHYVYPDGECGCDFTENLRPATEAEIDNTKAICLQQAACKAGALLRNRNSCTVYQTRSYDRATRTLHLYNLSTLTKVGDATAYVMLELSKVTPDEWALVQRHTIVVEGTVLLS